MNAPVASANINEADKIDLAPWGYAPGTGFYYCTDCQDGPDQGHRHNTRCAKHALEARLNDIRALDGDGEFTPVHSPSCQTNTLLRIMVFSAIGWAVFLAWLIAMHWPQK